MHKEPFNAPGYPYLPAALVGGDLMSRSVWRNADITSRIAAEKHHNELVELQTMKWDCHWKGMVNTNSQLRPERKTNRLLM